MRPCAGRAGRADPIFSRISATPSRQDSARHPSDVTDQDQTEISHVSNARYLDRPRARHHGTCARQCCCSRQVVRPVQRWQHELRIQYVQTVSFGRQRCWGLLQTEFVAAVTSVRGELDEVTAALLGITAMSARAQCFRCGLSSLSGKKRTIAKGGPNSSTQRGPRQDLAARK